MRKPGTGFAAVLGAIIASAAALGSGSAALAGGPDEGSTKEAVLHLTGIVLDIPGPWKDRDAFLSAFAKANGAAVRVDGFKLADAGGHVGAVFDVTAHDPKLANAIWIGTGRSLDAGTMDKIAAHKSVVTVVVPETGAGVEQRLRIFTGAVKKAGGYALRVHFSGLSHDWGRWEGLIAGELFTGLLQAVVVQVPLRDTGRLCSFGMVQFGHADACVADPGPDSDAAWVLFEFNKYLWQEKPALADGNTYTRNHPGAQTYVLKLSQDKRDPVGHEYTNPNGVWEIDPKL